MLSLSWIIISIILFVIVNFIFAFSFNEIIFEKSDIKYNKLIKVTRVTLLIPPIGIAAMIMVGIAVVFVSLRNSLIKYFNK